MANTSEPEIKPDSVKVYQVEEKSYTLSPNTYDIGTYLNLLKITPYQKINITLKEGNYTWNENYVTPEHTDIYMIGEKYKNGGEQNVVTILINQKGTQVSEGKEYAYNSKLQVRNSFFSITGIDIIEKINDTRVKYGSSESIGVFNLIGSQGSTPVFSLTFGRFEISSSPFINVQGNNVFGKVALNYSHFKKNSFANEKEISIIDTNSGWNGRGSVVNVSKTLITLAEGCKLLTKDSIIYHD